MDNRILLNNVVGLDDDGKDNAVLKTGIGASWFVTGNVFIWQDSDENMVTTGTTPNVAMGSLVIIMEQSTMTN